MEIFLFVVGLCLLIAGAEVLVRGAARLATIFGISPLVIGLTVVAFSTSSPELAVSFKAALSGQASIAVGNVIGSNIFNILFILGISALIVPLTVSRQLIRLDVPLMIILSVLLLLLSLDGRLNWSDGTLLVIGLVGYIWFSVYQSRKESRGIDKSGVHEGQKPPGRRVIHDIGLVLLGLVLLVMGSGWFVDGAVSFARHLGLSELVVGLTIVAAGTSLPEVVTSIIAAIRGERDIAVGNVVGSNIFNIMGVLGLSSMVSPTAMEVSTAAIHFDMPIMIAVAVACLPIFFTGGTISRGEGALFLAYYVAYTLYIVLAASHHDGLALLSTVMVFFVMPLTAVTIIVVTFREVQNSSKR